MNFGDFQLKYRDRLRVKISVIFDNVFNDKYLSFSYCERILKLKINVWIKLTSFLRFLRYEIDLRFRNFIRFCEINRIGLTMASK